MPCVDLAFLLMGTKVSVDRGNALSALAKLLVPGATSKKGLANARL
jgi:hypothetical protein